MVRLHEDPTHAGTGPICLQEARERGVVLGKARGRGNGELQFVPEASERRRPHSGRNRLAMMLAFEGAKGLDPNLKERTVDVVKSEEADEGTQRLAIGWKGPIVNKIEF
jgi:hypothetical protein